MPTNAGVLLGAAVFQLHEHQDIILQSLIFLGLKQLKKQGIESVLLEAGSTSTFQSPEQWGLASLQLFEFNSAVRLIESI